MKRDRTDFTLLLLRALATFVPHSDNDDLFEDDTPKKRASSVFGRDDDSGGGILRPNALPYQGGGSTAYNDSLEGDLPRQSTLSYGAPSTHGRAPIKSLTGTPGFDFDEDDEEQLRERQGAASRASGKIKESSSRLWDQMRDAVGLGKPKELGGERTIYINDPPANAQYRYMNNYVSTGKYNLITFIPKFLAGQSGERAN